MEIWKDVIGFEGLYQVSNLGRVKILSKKIKSMSGYSIRKEKYTKMGPNSRGYTNAALTKGGVPKIIGLHRLIAIHFIPNPENKPQINHKDGNKSNNKINNLEWCDASYNQTHAIINELRLHRHVFQYDKNHNFIKEYICGTLAGKELNIDPSCILKVCKNMKYRYTAGGFIWKYA